MSSDPHQPQSPKFYLTTPIYYVNARPHIGHAYTTIVADVLARRHRLLGHDTFFLTGTDEHGQKIERSAAAAGIPPQQFADEVSAQFRSLWDRMGLTYTQYIRTTDPAHKQGVQKLFRELYNRGHIYLSTYTGSYCVSDEAFVDLPPGTPCPDCGRLLETVTEENFFFKLSAFQLPLINLIEANDPLSSFESAERIRIEPASASNEVLSFLRGNVDEVLRDVHSTLEGAPALDTTEGFEAAEGEAFSRGLLRESNALGALYVPGALKDLSVSRSSFTWGIPVPEDVQQAANTTQPHVIYVWLDALANYTTAIGYGSDDPTQQAEFNRFWPADLHLVGKEITRFHCVYWPAFLLAAGLPTPKQITANGWLLFDNAKMSKSRGNVVRTETILDAFGTLCPPIHLTEGTTTPGPNGHELSPTATTGKGGASAPPQTPPTEPASAAEGGRGTASAVPLTATGQAALAAEMRPPTPRERDLFATDILRYFLLREIPFGQDGSFSFDALLTRYNADLANGYGNLVSRVLNMVEKYFAGKIPSGMEMRTRNQAVEEHFTYGASGERASQMIAIVERFATDLEANRFTRALDNLQEAVARVDQYLTEHAPWRSPLGWEETRVQERRALILYTAAESIRILTLLLHPILPYATAKVWQQLGLGDIARATSHQPLATLLQWGGLQPCTELGPLSPLFPRADKSLLQVMLNMEESRNTPHPLHLQEATAIPMVAEASLPTAKAADPDNKPSTDPAAAPRTSTSDPIAEINADLTVGGSSSPTPTLPTTPGPHTEAPASGVFSTPTEPAGITIDDFMKVELRVAQILTAERIPKADKLLRLEVDLGPKSDPPKRQILSGIAQHYTPEELIGRRIIVVSNLAPRKMRGLDSHGMLLAASEGPDGKPILATFAEDIPLGSRVR